MAFDRARLDVSSVLKLTGCNFNLLVVDLLGF